MMGDEASQTCIRLSQSLKGEMLYLKASEVIHSILEYHDVSTKDEPFNPTPLGRR